MSIPPEKLAGDALLAAEKREKEQLLHLELKLTGWLRPETSEVCTGFKIEPRDVVADIGCGDGGYAAFIARCGAEVIATDVDPAKVKRTEKRLRQGGATKFQTLVSDSNPLPLADGIATKVICREVLEHVDDPHQVMQELVRIGAPGALYLLSVPDPLGETIQKSVAPPSYWQKPNHQRIFGREEFEELTRTAGLEVEGRHNGSFYWTMYWILFWAADQKFGQPDAPILKYWTKTWKTLISSPEHRHIKKALDEFMPKSQAIIARKAA